jgi:hypothetical protein
LARNRASRTTFARVYAHRRVATRTDMRSRVGCSSGSTPSLRVSVDFRRNGIGASSVAATSSGPARVSGRWRMSSFLS